MVRKIFQDGDILYAADVNIIGFPIPDNEDLLGHGIKIIDGYLDDATTSLKSRFYEWYNRFKVTFTGGLQLTMNPGVVDDRGVLVNIPPSSIIAPINSVSYIWIGRTPTDSSVAIRLTSTLPIVSIPISRIVTNATTVVELADLRDVAVSKLPDELPQSTPVGSHLFSFIPSSSSDPVGYLECFGQAISRSLYLNLFAIIGTYYGVGDGVNTFNIPNTSGRFLLPCGTSFAPGAIAGNTNFNYPISNQNLPTHNHEINDPTHNHVLNQSPHGHGIEDNGHNHSVNDGSHAHQLPGFLYDTAAGEGSDGDGSAYRPTGSTTYVAQSNISINPSTCNLSVAPVNSNISMNATTTKISIRNTGDSIPLNVVPPFIALRSFIKY